MSYSNAYDTLNDFFRLNFIKEVQISYSLNQEDRYIGVHEYTIY